MGFALLLEARAAKYRSALGGLEGHCRLRAALRTVGPGLRAHLGTPANTLCLALFAMLGIVFELFVVKEELLAGCKNKLGAAITAFQDSVRKLHGRLPKEGNTVKSAVSLMTCRSRFPVFFR